MGRLETRSEMNENLERCLRLLLNNKQIAASTGKPHPGETESLDSIFDSWYPEANNAATLSYSSAPHHQQQPIQDFEAYQQPLVLVPLPTTEGPAQNCFQLVQQQTSSAKQLLTLPVTLITNNNSNSQQTTSFQPLKLVTASPQYPHVLNIGGDGSGGNVLHSKPLPFITLCSSQLQTMNDANKNGIQVVSIPRSVLQRLQQQRSNSQMTIITADQLNNNNTNDPRYSQDNSQTVKKQRPKPTRSNTQRLTAARVLYQQSCNAAISKDDENAEGATTTTDSPTIASALAYYPLNGNMLSTTVDGINLQEIKEFAKLFKLRRLALGLTQTQVGQALSAAKGPAYSQSAICRFEKLDITPKSAAKIKPVLEKWMHEAEKKYADRLKQGSQQHFAELMGDMNSKKRKRRTSFTPKALEKLNRAFESNTHPSGSEMTCLSHELDYDREVIRVWFCNKRQALKNTFKRMRPIATSADEIDQQMTHPLRLLMPSDGYTEFQNMQDNLQQMKSTGDICGGGDDDDLYQMFDEQTVCPSHKAMISVRSLSNRNQLHILGVPFNCHTQQSAVNSVGSEQLSGTPVSSYMHQIDPNLNMLTDEEMNTERDLFATLLRNTGDCSADFLDSILNEDLNQTHM